MLFLLTIIYLTAPLALFFLGWLKEPYAVGCVWILVVGVTLSASSSWLENKRRFPRLQRQDWVHLILAVLLIAGWVWLSSAGGFGYQRGDWRKHNAILNALLTRPWPVRYHGFLMAPGTSYLTYYMAYYLRQALSASSSGCVRPT